MKSLFVKCPHCKKKFDYSDEKVNKFRPFCSERCKMVDLGHWFNESYGVAATGKPEDEELEEKFSEEGEDESN